MWIFCGGMPRSGSTVQFQLTAHLVEDARRGARIEWTRPEEFPRVRDGHAARHDWKVFKSHTCTDEMLAEFQTHNAMGVYVFRDVRDVMLSRMRKSGASFETLWQAGFLDRVLNSFDRWTHLEAVLVSRYEEMVTDMAREVRRIAAHLGLSISPEQGERLASEYTVARQRERIRQAAATSRLQHIARVTYDPVSNLHLDHIRSGQIGEWRTALLREHVAMIEDRARSWLLANGYGLSASGSESDHP